MPALVFQPLVENAILHGIGKHKGVDEVQIRGFQKSDTLCLEVSNLNSHLDGGALQSQGRGVGLANTRTRLEQLYGPRQSLNLRNIEPVGVCAALSIPLRLAPSFVEELSR